MGWRLGLGLAMCAFVSLASLWAQGPDGGGAVLRSGFEDPVRPTASPTKPADNAASPVNAAPSAPKSSASDYLRTIFPEASPVEPADPSARRGFDLDEIPDINKDLQITPQAGAWMIMVISYTGKEGPMRARKMCIELRTKNRVPAYVFVYGAEERRKELERVRKIVEQQQAFFKQNNLTPDQPLRIRHQHIDVHHAVLIGGYPDNASATAALATVRAWPQPDPSKVDLDVGHYVHPGGKKEAGYINPFKRAFVCRNPTVKNDAPAEPKIDVAAMRRLTGDEPYSLFNCKKPYTLAVKEFQTPFMMHDRDTPSTIWESLTGSKVERQDSARISAHNLADVLRKVKLEAYVLHSKFSSTVTIGSFDSPDDPALRSMQELLAERFNQPPFTQIQFFHRPVPMAVPRS